MKISAIIILFMCTVMFLTKAYGYPEFYPNYWASDQGANAGGDTLTIKDCIDLANSNPITITLLNNGKVNDTTYSDTTKYFLATPLVIPSNVNLRIENGAILYKESINDTLTINGTVNVNGKYQIFQGFEPGDIKGIWQEVYPEWWGATGDTSKDNYNAIQSSIDSYFGQVNNGIKTGKIILSKYYRIFQGLLLKNMVSFEGMNHKGCGLYVKDTIVTNGPAGSFILTNYDGDTASYNVQVKNIEIIVENLQDTTLTCLYIWGAEGSRVSDISFTIYDGGNGIDTSIVKRLMHIKHGPIEIENINGHYSWGKVSSNAFYFEGSHGLAVKNINLAVPKVVETPLYFDNITGFCDVRDIYCEYVPINKPAIYAALANNYSTLALRDIDLCACVVGPDPSPQPEPAGNPMGIVLDANKGWVPFEQGDKIYPAVDADFLLENISIRQPGGYSIPPNKVFEPLIRYIDPQGKTHDWGSLYFSQNSYCKFPKKISKFSPHSQLFSSTVNLNNAYSQSLSEYIGNIEANGIFYIKRPKLWPPLSSQDPESPDNYIKRQAGAYSLIIAARDSIYNPIGGFLFIEHSHNTQDEIPPKMVFSWMHGSSEYSAAYDSLSNSIKIINITGRPLYEVTYSINGVFSQPIQAYKE